MKEYKNMIYIALGLILSAITYGLSFVLPFQFYSMLEFLASLVLLGIVLVGLGNVILGRKEKKHPKSNHKKQRSELISVSTDMFFIVLPMLILIVYHYVVR
ncbi:MULTISPECIES: hypothetical protein [Erysipelothrix]|uniref:Uncharacterized protein n=1 Tax=Erysipelothrix piscisicarius TaxID=2485784 RepID=A0A3S8RP96_9FIRM|nr:MULTISPECIES: hypothetical protein [Erysipelothrix]AZK44689.1 hypothetical protein EEI45_08185 [Erysipelothrix piscisicarius]MBK2402538.1 hypothetical protein [Erysipelothrix sp. strain 2 (EsS2-6-Brazil)]MBK2403477.1 hypothetical protein [Erysipelothrix sp. strain 2 (EsS2-7-Brazil)]NBA01523.1 hypothetical protein [Erysipelothrix rhusiopathiae]